ncbi:MAG: UDP-2,4-diacetamido-2,4,6-trideoxy-beta-L-altropyranose hydrolase [Marinagarivorans sp.]|nr:UDP-2,4-diacetamido-2,4,6-trideoxy-beta-L-altropyranose hydrolase [Marinagarivorans sp.]
MNIAFRVDAAPWIGSGHLMRCLTLAAALAEHGHRCIFICAYLNASFKEKILGQGFECLSLPAREDVVFNIAAQKQQHALWLGISQTLDAAQTIESIKGLKIAWLVVDHYSLDATWHSELRKHCQKIMVIDDLADRDYCCDLLLDQNFGRKASDYQKYINADAELLIGTDYCLLRAQFLKAHARSAKVLTQSPKKILLSFGGVDQDNFTLKALKTLVNSGYLSKNPLAQVAILVGGQYPHSIFLNNFINNILLSGRAKNITCHKNIDNVAELMATCDMAIGACGSTVWELCCLAVPALLVATANNQLSAITQLNEAGIIMALQADNFERELTDALNNKNIITELNALSQRALQCVDGKGMARVIKQMETLQ